MLCLAVEKQAGVEFEVIYTDDALWRKPAADRFRYAFDSRKGKQHHHYLIDSKGYTDGIVVPAGLWQRILDEKHDHC